MILRVLKLKIYTYQKLSFVVSDAGNDTSGHFGQACDLHQRLAKFLFLDLSRHKPGIQHLQ